MQGALKTCNFFKEKSVLKTLVNPMYFAIYRKIEVLGMDESGRKNRKFSESEFFILFSVKFNIIPNYLNLKK